MNTTVETGRELKNEIDNLLRSFEKDVKNLLAVSPEWEVFYTDCFASSATVHLALASSEHYTIDIRLYKEYGQQEKLSTNIATTGSFDMLDANENANYYIAVGNLLSKTEMLSKLKAAMKDAVDKVWALRKDYQKF